MAEETLQCPSCNQKVRAPQELLGQPVQCPLCRQIFTAPVRGGVAPMEPPLLVPAPPPQGAGALPPYGMQAYAPAPPADRETARALVKAPGTFLLVVGIIGLILSTLGVVMVVILMISGSDKMIDSLEQTLPPGPFLESYKQQLSPEGLVQSLILNGLFLILWIVICQGAVQMLRLRSFGLALAASVLAIINFQNCCCLLGAPAGIWALLVLLQPAVRNSFE